MRLHNETAGPNPYVFVVGCPRSGTTMLQRMLDHHPLLSVANDSHFITHPLEQLPIGVDPPLTPELVEWVRNFYRIHRLHLPDESFTESAAGSRTYGEFVGALYSVYARLRGKRLAGEKTGSYVKELPRLHALFPWVRTIHLIRDGRNVALSALEWRREDMGGPSHRQLWQTEPVGLCALWWRKNVAAGRQDGPHLGQDHYHEVRYEELVGSPAERLRELAAFLDLPDSSEMAAYHVGKTRHEPGLSSKRAWLPPTPGLRDWRTQMSPRDTALFEALAGDLLAELGYARGVDAFPAEVSETAERCREWWETKRVRRQAEPALAEAQQTLKP
jgi:hypothetical protein